MDYEDYETRLDDLRRFTKKSQARLKEGDLSGSLSLESLFEELTRLAETVLEKSERIARDELRRRGETGPGPFAIVAMGKFGGRELTYHSDLDLIFFYEPPETQEFATRLATRIISALSLVTQSGWAYKIDTALRPSGNSGTLVSSLSSFNEYHLEIGQIWEKQALIKGRPVVGPLDFAEKLRTTFEGIIYQNYDPAAVAVEIDRLRERMERELAREQPGRYNLKTGRGGIVDIEFAVQYLQLIHGAEWPELKTPNTLSALAALAETKIMDPALAQTLRRAYLFYRQLETRLRLTLDQSTDEIREDSEELKRTREDVRRIYCHLLGRILKEGT